MVNYAILKELKEEFNLTSTDGDEWGNVMHWWFTIADEIAFNRDDIEVPAEWQYRPSPLGCSNDEDDYALQAIRCADDDTLMRFGNMMHRYAKRLKKMGKDY